MATPVGIEYTGLRELNAKLKKIGVPDDAIKTAMNEAGLIVVREAQSLAPSKSGKMARTIKANKAKNLLKVQVGSKAVPYAYTFHAIALGRSRGGFTYVVNRHTRRGRYVKSYARQAYIPNRPFLFLAFQKTRAKVIAAYVTAMADLLQRGV